MQALQGDEQAGCAQVEEEAPGSLGDERGAEHRVAGRLEARNCFAQLVGGDEALGHTQPAKSFVNRSAGSRCALRLACRALDLLAAAVRVAMARAVCMVVVVVSMI